MVRLGLLPFLALALTQAAALPVDEVMNQLQNFLRVPEAANSVSVKSTTGHWDKEIDLTSTLGFLLKIKYTDPAHPLKGGHAHVELPGAKFIPNAPYESINMDIEFNGDHTITGLFDMKIKYTMVQARGSQEGTIVGYVKKENGVWKTKFTTSTNIGTPLDIALESDLERSLHSVINFLGHNLEVKAVHATDNSFNLELISGDKTFTGMATINLVTRTLTLEANILGQISSLKLELNPGGMWGVHITGNVMGPMKCLLTLQKDMKMGEVAIQHNGHNYIFLMLKGEAVVLDMTPKLLDYEVNYSMNSNSLSGTARIVIDGRSEKKLISSLSFLPHDSVKAWLYEASGELMSGGGVSFGHMVTHGSHIVHKESIVFHIKLNDETGFEVEHMHKLTMTEDSPFYQMVYLLTGKYAKNVEAKMAISHDKINTRFLYFPMMSVHSMLTLDGQKTSEFVYENNLSINRFKYFYQPAQGEDYFLEQIWEYYPTTTTDHQPRITTTDYYDNGCNYTMVYKRGGVATCTVGGDWTWSNTDTKFEFMTLDKVSQTEESPFYWMGQVLEGRKFNIGERLRTFSFDKINTRFLYFPIMSVHSMVTLDGQKTSEFVYENNLSINRFKYFYLPAQGEDFFLEQIWEYYPTTTTDHQPRITTTDYYDNGCNYTMVYKRGGVATCTVGGDWTWSNTDTKFEFMTLDKVSQTEESPFYWMGQVLEGRKFNIGERLRTFSFYKQDKTVVFTNKVIFDGVLMADLSIDTRSAPYTLSWYHQPLAHMLPTPRSMLGQDTLTISAWLTPHLKVETNLPQVQTLEILTIGGTKKIELNGNELATTFFDSNTKLLSCTVHLPNGEDMTMSVSWPKMGISASDLQLYINVSPDHELTTRIGWRVSHGKLSFFLHLDVKSAKIGNYKMTQNMEYTNNQNAYKLKSTGHAEATKWLAAFSPMDNKMVVSFNKTTSRVKWLLAEVIAGKTYSLVLTNDKVMLSKST